jgi:diaminopimelate epimerase
VLEGDDPESVREHVKVDGARYDLTALSMGNPHCVVFVNDVEHFPVEKVGRQISERKSLFPEGVNVEFVQVLSRTEIRMRVWERGAGETLACGTGACAAAAASAANGFSNRKVTVRLPGGSLSIDWLSTNRVMMTGPAVDVFWAEAPDVDALVEPLLAGKSEKE